MTQNFELATAAFNILGLTPSGLIGLFIFNICGWSKTSVSVITKSFKWCNDGLCKSGILISLSIVDMLYLTECYSYSDKLMSKLAANVFYNRYWLWDVYYRWCSLSINVLTLWHSICSIVFFNWFNSMLPQV